MAQLEEAETGDIGRARQWMARAVHAALDPAWTADGLIAESWMPVSPATGRLDAFQWRVPVAELTPRGPLLEPPPSPPAMAARVVPKVIPVAKEIRPEVETTLEPRPDPRPELKPEPKAELKPETRPEAKPDVQIETRSAPPPLDMSLPPPAAPETTVQAAPSADSGSRRSRS
jgi:HemY protein